MFKDKTIALGITSCSNAYKAAELASQLVKKGADVKVIMTENATQFIGPLTLRNITKNPVVYDSFGTPPSAEVRKEKISEDLDVLLIAPATANTIGKAANGIADNLLLTTILSTDAPVIFVPQMNPRMYGKPAVQRNIAQLKADGYFVLEESRVAAEGRIIGGSMPDLEKILAYVAGVLKSDG